MKIISMNFHPLSLTKNILSFKVSILSLPATIIFFSNLIMQENALSLYIWQSLTDSFVNTGFFRLCELTNLLSSLVIHYTELSKSFSTTYDESSNIGKRYRRQDAIGTPFCITIDDETLNNNTVTIRNRDTMKQDIISIDEIENYINKELIY